MFLYRWLEQRLFGLLIMTARGNAYTPAESSRVPRVLPSRDSWCRKLHFRQSDSRDRAWGLLFCVGKWMWSSLLVHCSKCTTNLLYLRGPDWTRLFRCAPLRTLGVWLDSTRLDSVGGYAPLGRCCFQASSNSPVCCLMMKSERGTL